MAAKRNDERERGEGEKGEQTGAALCKTSRHDTEGAPFLPMAPFFFFLHRLAHRRRGHWAGLREEDLVVPRGARRQHVLAVRERRRARPVAALLLKLPNRK
jgi:hypothetical protein